MSHPTTTTSPPLPSLPPISLFPSLPLTTQTPLLDLLFEPTPALHPLIAPLLAISHPSWDALIDAVRARLHALAERVSGRVGEADSQTGDAGARRVLEEVLAAHPRLGEKRVESAMSRMEQARMAAASGVASSGSDAASSAHASSSTHTSSSAPASTSLSAGAETEAVEQGSEKKDEAQHHQQQQQAPLDAETEAQMLRELNSEYEQRFPGLRYVVFVNGRPRSVIMDDMRQRIQRGDVRAERREAVDAMCDIAKDRCRKLGVEA